jgi:hypothetical protein
VVETGGLENRCTGNRTGGSNPSPSAKQSGLQRIPAFISLESCEIRAFFAIPARQVGLRRTHRHGNGWYPYALFSPPEMSSPTCNKFRGEHLAIRNRLYCEHGLDFPAR